MPSFFSLNSTLLFLILFSTGCSCTPGIAPASVARKTLEFRFCNGEIVNFHFTENNLCMFPEIPEGYGNSVEYRKTGVDTATLECEVWESIGTYTMHFSSSSGGSASYAGVIEGADEQENNIPFLLK